jgi:hypothetical protein
VFNLPQSPRLRRILFAYTVNELGTWFAYVALSVAVYDQTHNALAIAGLFVSARLLPAILVPALVARVEVSPQRGTLTILYLIEALAVTALVFVLDHFWLPGVFLLVALDGSAALTAAALLRAAAARVAVEDAEPVEPRATVGQTGAAVRRENAKEMAQRRANAALNVAYTATVAVGPALGGLIVATSGVSLALLVDVATFLACGAMLIGVRTHVEEMGRTSVRARLQIALEHVRRVPVLRELLVTEAVALVFFASVEPIDVVYAKLTLGAGDLGFGLLVGSWGAGMVIGAIIFMRSLQRPLGPMLTVGTLMVGVAYLGTAAAPDLAVACGASVVGGVGNGIQWASLISALQQFTPAALLGRLMSAVEGIGALCPAIGFVLGGVVTQLSSPRAAFLVAGLVVTGATGVFYRMSVRTPALAQPLAPLGERAEQALASETLIPS